MKCSPKLWRPKYIFEQPLKYSTVINDWIINPKNSYKTHSKQLFLMEQVSFRGVKTNFIFQIIGHI